MEEDVEERGDFCIDEFLGIYEESPEQGVKMAIWSFIISYYIMEAEHRCRTKDIIKQLINYIDKTVFEDGADFHSYMKEELNKTWKN